MTMATMNASPSTIGTAPTGPCFCSSIKGYFSFEEGGNSYSKSSRYALVNGFFGSLRVFDAHGYQWRVERVDTRQPLTWWTKFLTRTVYNPCIETSVVWAEAAAYSVDDLKAEYTRAVDRDDDILTQFVDRDELRRRIAACADFDAVVAVYRWAGTDHDE